MVYCATVIREWIKLSGLQLTDDEKERDRIADERTREWVRSCQVSEIDAIYQ